MSTQLAPQPAAADLSVTGKNWQLRPRDWRVGTSLAQKLGLPDVLGQILASRDVGTKDLADALTFLTPRLDQLPDPSHLLDMDIAVDRLVTAIENGEKLAIFGDYDVDGSAASAVLLRYFRALGSEPILYVPDRLSEGYGPNIPAMHSIKEQGAHVLITVDCGSLAFEPFAEAKKIGLDVIITDHHQTQPEKPECIALVNPNRVDETTNCKMLSGAGVAFYLVMALNRELRKRGYFEGKSEPAVRDLLDLVALSTVCDMVPLRGVNRVLVERGLKVMAQNKNAGITALRQLKQQEGAPTPYDAGFVIGPRINAGGRVAECDLGCKILAEEDASGAMKLAQRLDLFNDQRKEIEEDVLEQALNEAQRKFRPENPVLVVAGYGWHPGVIGIVASRVKDRYHRPTFVIGIDKDGVCKGSGRSIAGIDMGRAVIQSKDVLEAGGGHAMAAGLTVKEESLEAFEAKFRTLVQEQADKSERDVFVPGLMIDSALTPGGANLELMDQLAKLEPYGVGHPEPRFVFNNVSLSFVKAVGADARHVKLTMSDGSGQMDGICFGAMDSDLGPFLMGQERQKVSVVGVLRVNEWQGVKRVQLQVQDARKEPFIV